VHFTHLLNLVQVNNEASFVSMILFDAFSAKHSKVVGAIKVLHSLLMFVAEKTVYTFVVLKVDVS